MKATNELTEVLSNTAIGVTGGVTSICLNQVNEVLSLLVAVATLVYLVLSIIKKVREMKRSKDG
jgi:hypothetical protein